MLYNYKYTSFIHALFTTLFQRTFRVYINEANKTTEIIMYLLIAVLVIRTILKTSATDEHHHNSAPKK